MEVIETLSRADASVGWCAFIWADSGIYSGYLDDAVAREMYARLDMATSGWVHPAGTARRVDGGYRMSGRWMFGSGCGHCDWLVAGRTVLERDGSVARDANGRAPWRILYARPDDYEILDTWYTTGLRGTGSNDYRCEDVFVAEERADAWLSRTNAFQTARRVVALLYDTVGGNAIYTRRSLLDRNLRDIQTACQHILGQTKMLEDAGGLLLGDGGDHPLM